MPKVPEQQRIFDVVEDIHKGGYRLPSIQRSFVWEEERACKLLDSIMSEYPIGSFLVWSPPPGIHVKSRPFVENYQPGERGISQELTGVPYHLVLDGQQRLQSLYLSFFGTYDGRKMYFRVDCDPAREEDGLSYDFQFLSDAEAGADPHWLHPLDIVALRIDTILEFVGAKFPGDSTEVRTRIGRNLSRFVQVFNMDRKVTMQEIEPHLSYNDVLEVFVRVNSGGVVLTKSDLVFSTVVSKMPDMDKEFIELVDELNGRGEYDFDIDFVIKASFVLFDQGAKYGVEKLSDDTYIRRLGADFDSLKQALISTLEFLKSDAKLLTKRFLKSDLALIPIVDYIFRQPHQQIPPGAAADLRQYLYMAFFMRFYYYGTDGKLDAIHRMMGGPKFPLDKLAEYMSKRTGLTYAFDPSMTQDADLVLNIIEDGVYEVPKRRGWSLEKDHIFAHSTLVGLGISESQASSYGNLRWVGKVRNILKTDKLPEEDLEFYGSKDPTVRPLYLEARRSLDDATFSAFVQARERLILGKVRRFLGFNPPD